MLVIFPDAWLAEPRGIARGKAEDPRTARGSRCPRAQRPFSTDRGRAGDSVTFRLLLTAALLLSTIATAAGPAGADEFALALEALRENPGRADQPPWIAVLLDSGGELGARPPAPAGSSDGAAPHGGLTLGIDQVALGGAGAMVLVLGTEPERRSGPEHALAPAGRLPNLYPSSAALGEPSWADRVPAGSGTPWLGLALTSGTMVSSFGYEAAAPDRHPGGSSGYLATFALPLSYTGLMVSAPMTGWLDVDVGAVNGWSLWEVNVPSAAGRVRATPATDLDTSLGWIVGPEPAVLAGGIRYALDLVVRYHLVERLDLGLNTAYGRAERDASAAGSGQDTRAEWYGAAAYVSHRWPGRLRAALRQEWFVDQDGTRTGFGSRLAVFSSTATVEVDITRQLMTRVEYRHDSADEPLFSGGRWPASMRTTRSTVQWSLVAVRP